MKIFLPDIGFNARFLDPAIAADCGFIYFFGHGFWTLRVIKIFLARFRNQGENGRADLVNKS